MSLIWLLAISQPGPASATRNAYLTARQAICLQFRGP